MPSFQSTRWCFTINNPTGADNEYVRRLSQRGECKYLVVGREQGEQGTPHLQGFVVYRRGATRTRVSSHLPRAHLEPARASSHQCAEYCKKEGDFDEYGEVPRPSQSGGILEAFYTWGDAFIQEHGRAPNSPEVARAHPTVYLRYNRAVRLFQSKAPAPAFDQGALRDWQDDLQQLLEDEADDRKIMFVVDPVGGKGKSWFQRYYLTSFPDRVQILGVGKRDDLAHAIDESKDIFFFNVPRATMEYFQYPILEMLKDRVVYSPKYSSRTKYLLRVPHVVVFTNDPPNLAAMSRDRYTIINL